MIQGIGLDVIELSRIQTIIERQPRFYTRVLTETEQQTFLTLKGSRQVEFLAGRFAAKEACAKALGCGIGGELSFQDIQIDKDALGKPILVCAKAERAHVSITHSREFAAAQVIIEKA
ncbi:holo-ACP synthase [Paenalkalicoccus suaedae]|uniref:Holo-[acyl-carrier-protein] synthase n=1 Tax=Paenalkalicoccus suaedae TaxID=2592382 RepID=A0A859FB06_9BACI|nr:holo-ACP synthase [Paenalkalicoccus suaedae]QKS70187.1 holo-ACP synthase [Paenalkalicoccus suaedae]